MVEDLFQCHVSLNYDFTLLSNKNNPIIPLTDVSLNYDFTLLSNLKSKSKMSTNIVKS